ncbi:MAG: nucleotidyltransferase, partial [Terriglobia bacterium]
MTPRDLLKEKRDEILRIAAKHGARNVRVFGS